MINGFNEKNKLSLLSQLWNSKTPHKKTQICPNLFFYENPFNRFFINSKYNTDLLLKIR